MQARLRHSICLLAASTFSFAASIAAAGELVVMPYTCQVSRGQVVLRPSPNEGHRIVTPRQNRDFTACSPVDPSMCRKWTVHRFDVDCGGERVPWTEIVAAADGRRQAWVENGRLNIRMPRWWTAPPGYGGGRGAGGPPATVQMPYGFAPKFGLDAIFVDEGGPKVGGYSSGPSARDRDFRDRDYAEAPAYPREERGYGGRGYGDYGARPPRDLPFEVKPPEEGLTVEDVREPGGAADAREPSDFGARDDDLEERGTEYASEAPLEPLRDTTTVRDSGVARETTPLRATEPEPPAEPEVTWSEPPPLPTRLDPAERRQMAQSHNDSRAGSSEVAHAAPMATRPASHVPSEPPASASTPHASNAGAPSVPAIINGSGAASAEHATQVPPQPPPAQAGPQETAPAPQPPAGNAAPNSPQDTAGVHAVAGSAAALATAPNAAAPGQSGALATEPTPQDGAAQPNLIARIVAGEPVAVGVAVIAASLLGLLLVGLGLSRRREPDLPDLTDRDLSTISWEKARGRPNPTAGPGPRMPDLGDLGGAALGAAPIGPATAAPGPSLSAALAGGPSLEPASLGDGPSFGPAPRAAEPSLAPESSAAPAAPAAVPPMGAAGPSLGAPIEAPAARPSPYAERPRPRLGDLVVGHEIARPNVTPDPKPKPRPKANPRPSVHAPAPAARQPQSPAMHAGPRPSPVAAWGDAIPLTHADALRVLGMGVTRDASPASIKKIVDGLRMSWHPDYATDEADRRLRELRMKQINAAWEIISGTRREETDQPTLRRPERLPHL